MLVWGLFDVRLTKTILKSMKIKINDIHLRFNQLTLK